MHRERFQYQTPKQSAFVGLDERIGGVSEHACVVRKSPKVHKEYLEEHT
jgi:hypothetical protein